MFEFLRKLLAGSNEGEIKKLMKIVEQINAFEPQTKALTDDQLRGKTAEFRAQLENVKTLDDLLPEAYAVVREATRRVLGKRHFDVDNAVPEDGFFVGRTGNAAGIDGKAADIRRQIAVKRAVFDDRAFGGGYNAADRAFAACRADDGDIPDFGIFGGTEKTGLAAHAYRVDAAVKGSGKRRVGRAERRQIAG